MTATAVAPDAEGRIDLDAVEAECARGDVGTVVLTTGSTGLGAIDRVDEALALRERYGVRLHVDGAYGGFFTLLARGDDPLVAPGAVRGDRAVRLGRGRSPQARPSALRVRRGALRRSRGAAGLSPRLAVHLLHRGRPAPRRDQPGVLARGRGGRGAVADAAGAAAGARRGPRRGARGRTARRARLGGAAALLRRARAARRARARHRHLPAASRLAVGARRRQRRRPRRRAWRTPTIRSS